MRGTTEYIAQRESLAAQWKRDFKRNGSLYLLALPVVVFYIVFSYRPMYGALIAFKDFVPRLGFYGSEWVGLRHFNDFFSSPDFFKVLRNTLTISLSNLVFAFPMPIILAIMLNEMRSKHLKSFVQTMSYLPHFISLVVICGMIKTFVSSNGVVSIIAAMFTGENTNLLMQPESFVPIYVLSDIWQSVGWDSIIYLAALSAVDVQQYEAAEIDGAGRWDKIIHITFPSIMATVITMLILRVGRIMSVGYEKVILLYNPAIYDVSDIISSYVYRMGFQSQNWGYSTAVGLFNSVINLILLLITNGLSKRLSETSLW